MAVVGVDFGTLHSKIAVARRRGVDVMANDVSNRATPSLVAFGPKQRTIGEAAKSQETSNFKNTIGSLKRLIGRTLDDPQVQKIEKKFLNATLVDIDGTLGVEVNYLGERQSFTFTQLAGAYLGHLRDAASKELKTNVTDLVIAVPGWYTDIQRRAIIDAAAIAGLNILRIIHDTTAAALGYGITKSDLPEPENPRHVAFVDAGHGGLSVAIVAFAKGKLTVQSTAYDPNLGGRDIDYRLLTHFAEEFKTKYKIDVLSSPKACFRLAAGCEKLKKVLSANIEAPLNVESLMNDIDASSKLTREQLETLIAPLLDAVEAPIQRAIAGSGLTLDQIDSIELVGGSTRVPALRNRIQQAFGGKQLSYTLNQDEAVARGATFACAMLSPVFRVRDFAAHDINHYPIKIAWEPVPTDPDDDTEIEVFPQGNVVPSTKILSFYRKEKFSIEAAYAQPSQLPGVINPVFASATVPEVPVDPKGDSTLVKVKTRLNLHGILSFESTYTEEIEEKEEHAPAPMDVDKPADGAEGTEATPVQPPPVKKKRIVKKNQVQFVAKNTSLDKVTLENYKEKELEMHAADKLVQDTENSKNALEEHIYDTRGKLDDAYAPFVQDSEKSELQAELNRAEDWLYSEEGEDSTKSVYVTHLGTLKTQGDRIAKRYREYEDRPKAIASLRETLNNYTAQATSTDDKYSHIDAGDKEKVVGKCAVTGQWLEDLVVKQAERPKNVDPVLTNEEVHKKRDEVIYLAAPIMSKPKPKPPVPSSTGGTPQGGTPGTQTPKPETPKPETQEQKKEETGMDVD